MRSMILVASTCLLLQACAATPVKTNTKQTVTLPASSSTVAIKTDREDKYTQRLRELSSRDPIQQVANEKSRGNYFLLGYDSGRGGIRKIPGLSPQVLNNSSCGFKRLDGFGDTIYGRNHLKYRIEMRKYASQFNRAMISSCGRGKTTYLKTR